jgi:hypothetical protein
MTHGLSTHSHFICFGIYSSLQAWQRHGRPHSELLKAQREQEGGSTLGGPLRYTDTLIFWVQCQQVRTFPTFLCSGDSAPPSMRTDGLTSNMYFWWSFTKIVERHEPELDAGATGGYGFRSVVSGHHGKRFETLFMRLVVPTVFMFYGV